MMSLAEIFIAQMDLSFFTGEVWLVPVMSIAGACIIMLATSIESLRDFIEETEY